MRWIKWGLLGFVGLFVGLVVLGALLMPEDTPEMKAKLATARATDAANRVERDAVQAADAADQVKRDAVRAADAADQAKRTAVASATAAVVAVANDTIDLQSLLSSYKDNEIASDASFKGKQIRVTGIVGAIKKDILDRPYVTVGTGEEFEIPTVQCSLSTNAVNRAAALHKGDSVTVRGTVTGLFVNVQMENCEIL